MHFQVIMRVSGAFLYSGKIRQNAAFYRQRPFVKTVIEMEMLRMGISCKIVYIMHGKFHKNLYIS